jgi:hypothetical protein
MCRYDTLGSEALFHRMLCNQNKALVGCVLVGLAVWRGEDGCAKSAVSDSFSSLKEKEAFVDSRGMHIALLPSHRSYNQGLISADRSNKATLLLTIPRCLLSRLQRISHAQLVKLSCNPGHPLSANGPVDFIRYRPKLSIHASSGSSSRFRHGFCFRGVQT